MIFFFGRLFVSFFFFFLTDFSYICWRIVFYGSVSRIMGIGTRQLVF